MTASAFLQRHALEQLLWKTCFYKVIEEFRRRLHSTQGDLQRKASPPVCFFAPPSTDAWDAREKLPGWGHIEGT